MKSIILFIGVKYFKLIDKFLCIIYNEAER